MVMIVPKEETEAKDDIRDYIRDGVIRAGLTHGVPWELMMESKTLEDCIEGAVNTVYFLKKMLKTQGTETNMLSISRESETTYFKPLKMAAEIEKTIKEFKKFDELDDEIEKKERVKDGGRKIRNAKK